MPSRAAVLDASPNAIVAIDASGKIIYANPQTGVTFGYTPAELIGQSIDVLLPEGIRGRHAEHREHYMRQPIARPMGIGMELRGRHRDGHEFPVEISLAPVELPRGIAIYATVVDISARKAAERDLANSEQRFRALFEQSAVATVMERGGTIVAANRAAAVLFGYPDAAAIVGQPGPMLVAPSFLATALQRLRRVMVAPRGTPLEIEGVARRADGSEFPARALRSEIGLPEGRTALIHVTDLSEQYQREAELARLLSAIDQSPDTIVVTDLEGRVAYLNAAALRAVGRERDDILGQPATVLARDLPGAIDDHVAAALAATGSWTGVVDIPHADGSIANIDVVISVIRDEAGAGVGAVSIGRDVSHERAIEEQLRHAQKMEAVGRLAGGIAHDFNNLLTVISGNAAFLMEDLSAGDPGRADATEIAAAADRAAALTRQLLAFSRKQVLKLEVLDLGSVVGNLVPLIRRMVEEDVEVTVRTGSQPTLVRADRSQIEQVVMNLAVNARDAMPAGGTLTIAVRPAQLDDAYAGDHVGVVPGAYAELLVADSGVGMDRATQAHVFEPFFTTKGPAEGTGLGLSTVDGIIRQLGGHIWLYSEPGIGTSFKIYLPRLDHEGEPHPAERVERRAAGGHGTVLLVEDEDGVRLLARRILERAGYTVYEASNVAEGLAVVAASAEEIDILLTDFVMPGGFGSEIARAIAARNPRCGVVFMSGYADETIRERGSLTPDAYLLHKPFTRDSLLMALRRAIREVDRPH